MSTGKFITNKQKILKETISNILPTSEKIDMLVGFFYFSGFSSLYLGLEDKQIRVLVGMDIELDGRHNLKEVFRHYADNGSNAKSSFIEQLKTAFNKTDVFDNEATRDSVEIFIRKIADCSLQIRKTFEPNHSKLYLFHEHRDTNHKGDRPGTLITGSSNFSYSGLEGRYELNARFDDKESFDEGVKIFEELWDNSVEITIGGEDDKVKKAIEHDTWINIPSPFEAYLRVLYEYFHIKTHHFISPEDLTNGKIKDLEYQVDAIKKGLNIIQEHNGVIIADVVGLGKSIIGSTLIANLGKRAIVIAPPHLVKQWENYGDDFGLTLKIYSSGKIQEALEHSIKNAHAYDLVLIDEAHRYRTSGNIDYGYLQQLTQGKRVILLTATPFNNSPEDIFNLIKLFQMPRKSTLQTSRMLSFEFQSLIKEYDKIRREEKEKKKGKEELRLALRKISDKIKSLIYPVVIRRSRIDLEKNEKYRVDLQKQGYTYSKVRKPETLEFDLGELKDDYITTINGLLDAQEQDIKKKRFKCARYMPLAYLKPEFQTGGYYSNAVQSLYGYQLEWILERQKNMQLFITRLMVARFESSVASFRKTIDNMLETHRKYEGWIRIGKIPVIGKGNLPSLDELDFDDFGHNLADKDGKLDMEKLKTLSTEEINTLLKNEDGFLIDIAHLDEDFRRNFESDIRFLESLKAKWGAVKRDPKLDHFIRKVTKDLSTIPQAGEPKRKIVVFSQFTDTVNAVYDRCLEAGLRVLRITADNKNKKNIQTLMENFDAGLSEGDQKDEYDIVVATDAISEGYNLHRAGSIYNYDIPYNPTIIIQRVGRINRINKRVFGELDIFNFFPSLIGSAIVHAESIAKLKITMINFILGTDTRTLEAEETLDSFYNDILQADESYNEEPSWDIEYENLFNDIRKHHKEELTKARNLPDRTRLRRKSTSTEDAIITFAKKGGILLFKIIDKKTQEIKTLTVQEALEIFRAEREEKGYRESDDFYPHYNTIKQELFRINTDEKIDPSVRKAIDNLERFEHDFEKEFYRLLKNSIVKLGNIPDVYLTILRELTPQNRIEKIHRLMADLHIESLRNALKASENLDLLAEELIISEEF